MKFAILGPSCFGINLALYLQSKGHEVFGVGRSPKRPDCFSLGLDWDYRQHHLTYEPEPVVHFLRQKQPDFIINFAAQGESAASFNGDSWRYFETNSLGLTRLVPMLEAPFIQIGSSEVYGPTFAKAGESQLLNPTSPYSISKGAFDLWLVAMREKIVPFNIVRPSNCYTAGQQLHRIIPKTLLLAMTGKKLQLHGGGRAQKSYMDALDLSRAILMICEKGNRGHIYNVGPDEAVSIKTVVEYCAQLAGVRMEDFVEHVPGRFGEDAKYWINSEKVKRLGWRQETSLKAGIYRVHEWIKKYLPELKNMPTEFRMRP